MEGRVPIDSPHAPNAIGPYSHAVRHGALLYCSGMLPIDPENGDVQDGSIGDETDRCLRNLAAVCQAAETDLANSLRLTIYTTRLDLFGEINEVYARFFPDAPPARATLGVAALPKGVQVEIDAIVAV